MRKRPTMKPSAGLWIDRGEAVIVMISNKGRETRRIKSNIKKQLRYSGGDDSRERDGTGHPAIFYDEVIAGIRTATSVLILGPDEAKVELKKRLETNASAGRRVEMRTADRMTERQIVQEMQERFHAAPGSRVPTWDATPPENMNCEG